MAKAAVHQLPHALLDALPQDGSATCVASPSSDCSTNVLGPSGMSGRSTGAATALATTAAGF